MTERLGDSLERSMPKYEDRFYNGLKDSVAAVASGCTVQGVRDMGRGNHEVHFKCGSGHERRPIFFKELNNWRLNRL